MSGPNAPGTLFKTITNKKTILLIDLQGSLIEIEIFMRHFVISYTDYAVDDPIQTFIFFFISLFQEPTLPS